MLARFERLMEQAVEGSLRRVFPTTLQPIQLAKAAARAMEQGAAVGVRGVDVPNLYELRLSTADLGRFAEQREQLTTDVRDYLVEYANERGLRSPAPIRVELREDARARDGSVRAEARFADLAPGVQQGVNEAVAATRELRLADLNAALATDTSAPAKLSLSDGASLRFDLEPRMEVVRLGRATDNDVVLESQRISRYHCHLRWLERGWLVYDLNSTNGTWLDEQRVEAARPRLVRDGSRLRLGDFELSVNRGRR